MLSTLISFGTDLYSSRPTSLLICPFSFQKRHRLNGHFHVDLGAKSQLFYTSYLCPSYLALGDHAKFVLPLWGDWEAGTTQLWGWEVSLRGANCVRAPGNHCRISLWQPDLLPGWVTGPGLCSTKAFVAPQGNTWQGIHVFTHESTACHRNLEPKLLKGSILITRPLWLRSRSKS